MKRMSVLILVALTSVGCAQVDRVRTIPADDVPHNLLATATESASSDSPTKPSIQSPRVYFLKSPGTLGPFPAKVTSTDTRDGISELLAALTAGPSQAQKEDSVRTVIPVGAELKLVSISDGRALISVATDPSAVRREDLPYFAAQIVLTLTSVQGVDSVLFQNNEGERQSAVLPDGSATNEPLTTGVYSGYLQEELVPSPTSATAPSTSASPTAPSDTAPSPTTATVSGSATSSP